MSILKALFKEEKENIKEGLDRLLEESSPDKDFYLLLALSAVITTIGLIIDNPAVVIGGMLVAPLLFPLLRLGMGIVMADFRITINSLIILIEAILVVIVVSSIVSLVFFIDFNEEIISRTIPSVEYFFIAFASGLAAAYTYVRKEAGASLPGVAVAVSLIPPVCVLGISISQKSWDMVLLSGTLFGVNILGIIVAGILVFSSTGFWRLKKRAQKKIEQEEKELDS